MRLVTQFHVKLDKMKMDNEQLNIMRAEVIERAIGIELMMSAIISFHYFGRISMPFLLEVLYDEYFSFALKRRVVEKIAPHADHRRFNELNRLGTIRNYFAHCSPNILHPETMERVAVDPKHLDRTIDFQSLFQEFSRLHDPVHKHLEEILIAMGGQPIKKIDDILGQQKNDA
jgi:hypothetical protein